MNGLQLPLRTKTHRPNVFLSQGWIAAAEYSLPPCCLLLLNIYYKQLKQNCLPFFVFLQTRSVYYSAWIVVVLCINVVLSVFTTVCMNWFHTKLWSKFFRSFHFHPNPSSSWINMKWGCSQISVLPSAADSHSWGSYIHQLKHQLDPLLVLLIKTTCSPWTDTYTVYSLSLE